MNLICAKEALVEWQRELCALNHAMSVLYYDGATTAPKGTSANRGVTLAVLSRRAYELSTSEQTVEFLTYLDEHKEELDAREQRIVELATKDMREMRCIPKEEYVAYQQLLVEADDVWHTAKEEDDFAAFCPFLEKIFETERRFAGYCAPDKAPYDYCIGKYEDGLTTEVCDQFFATLRERLVPLIRRIGKRPQVDDSCLHGHFDEALQERFSLMLMQTMGIDLDHCGLGVTEHPFTTSLGSHHDVRITTHYQREDVSSSMYSVIHEGGHALYDMHSDDALAYTLLDGGVSMGIHESQSRFYENLIGRSRPFLSYIFPAMRALFPESMRNVTAEDVYRAVNKVTPSLIRTEADEVTYCLHVMIRYELERGVMEGRTAVRDLPAEWRRLYREYLGVEVPNDREGVLQDSHWSGGGIGYFPSYALGSAYGAQLLRAMRREVDVDASLARGDMTPINEWNRLHIWRYGCEKKPMELLEAALGEPFDPTVYIDYLESKYGEIYGLTEADA